MNYPGPFQQLVGATAVAVVLLVLFAIIGRIIQLRSRR